MSTQSQVAQKRGVSIKSILLALFVAAIAVFATMNRATVPVWPLGQQSLIVVIAISFVLGALVGWLIRSMTHRRVIVERQVD